MRSNNVSGALREVFIHQGMNCCLLAGCDAQIEHGQYGHVDCGFINGYILAARNWRSLDGQPSPALEFCSPPKAWSAVWLDATPEFGYNIGYN
jgi:hypothetical protein